MIPPLKEFVWDRDRRELVCDTEEGVLHCVKAKFDDDTDAVYGALGLEDFVFSMSPLPFYGYASYKQHIFLGHVWSLVGGENDPDVTTFASFTASWEPILAERVRDRIWEMPPPVEEYPEPQVLRYLADLKAWENFYSHKGCQYDVAPMLELAPATTLVGLINHPDETADRLVTEYLEEHEKSVTYFRNFKPFADKYLKKIEETPGEHHYRRKIRDAVASIKDKEVNVTFEWQGKRCNCRMYTDVLRCPNGNYSESDLDPTSRDWFIKVFGKGKIIHPSDIESISTADDVHYRRRLDSGRT